ncbi:MAG: hypothetical protein AABY27_04495 [Pseudomonadota bacterium]
MKIISILSVVLVLILLTGCSQKVVCNKPYILVGSECCLDTNDNQICDKDETAKEVQQKSNSVTNTPSSEPGYTEENYDYSQQDAGNGYDNGNAMNQQQASGQQDSQLAQLILSSAWCSFSYNSVSGASSSSRYKYFSDGTFSYGSQAETYSSGYGGTYAGGSQSGDSGRWSLNGNQMTLTFNNGQQLSSILQINYNSNGYPIIVADGTEFSKC